MWIATGHGNRGIAGVWVVTALVALLGMAALVIDVGRLIVAAQRAQDVTDSAALAGGCELPYEQDACQAAVETVQANNSEGTGLPVECSYVPGEDPPADNDVVYYGACESVPGYMELGPWASAVRVTSHVPVEYGFARIMGIEGATATRSATVVRGPVRGVPIATMWVADQELVYEQELQLLMADGPHYAGIPGSFGFVQSPDGCTASFFELLQSYNLTHEDVETAFVDIGDTLYAETGEMVGHWRKALEQDLGRSRLEQGTSGKWAGDTFYDYQPDNPRIMLVPLVTYLGGSGSNAAFEIVNFGAFWLEEVRQGQREIIGRFIRYDLPSADLHAQGLKDGGIFTTELVR